MTISAILRGSLVALASLVGSGAARAEEPVTIQDPVDDSTVVLPNMMTPLVVKFKYTTPWNVTRVTLRKKTGLTYEIVQTETIVTDIYVSGVYDHSEVSLNQVPVGTNYQIQVKVYKWEEDPYRQIFSTTSSDNITITR